MTEHESEKFYQDLRRKLDGYGSAPPEAVWDAIRTQVPVRRSRRWQPVLLLLLLGAIGSGIIRYNGSLASFFGTPETGGPTAHRLRPTGGGGLPATRHQPSLAASPSSPLTGNAATSPLATADAASAAIPVADASAGAAAGTRWSPELGAVGITALPAKRRTTPIRVAGPDNSRTHRGIRREATLAATTTALAAADAAATSHNDRHYNAPQARRRNLTLAAGSRQPRLPRSGTGIGSDWADASSARAAVPRGRAARVGGSNRRRLAANSRATARRVSQPAPAAPETTGAAGATAVRTREAANPRALAGRNQQRPERRYKISNAPLALLVVRPVPPLPEEPVVEAARRNPRKRPTRQEIRLRNWSAQLLLGSGLSYRALGGTATQLERLERPALGFSGQATAAYAFSRQLSVAAGVGYTEYATSLAYELKKANQETTTRKDFRDAYRFFTVPVQAQLTLRGTPRWRYGVLGGGTLALLAGAQTTEGSACNCQQTQWSMSDQRLPFSRTNLLLAGGAFASYQFALGQWFTIRPQGELLLNSLTTPASGRAARRPWNLGVQAGYSWDLDPRKH